MIDYKVYREVQKKLSKINEALNKTDRLSLNIIGGITIDRVMEIEGKSYPVLKPVSVEELEQEVQTIYQVVCG